MCHRLGSESMLIHGVTFNLDSAKVSSPAILETYVSSHKDIWNAATDYSMYFDLIVLLPLTAVLLLINFTAL